MERKICCVLPRFPPYPAPSPAHLSHPRYQLSTIASDRRRGFFLHVSEYKHPPSAGPHEWDLTLSSYSSSLDLPQTSNFLHCYTVKIAMSIIFSTAADQVTLLQCFPSSINVSNSFQLHSIIFVVRPFRALHFDTQLFFITLALVLTHHFYRVGLGYRHSY